MKILIISDNNKLYLKTQQTIPSTDQIIACTFSEISKKVNMINESDIIIMDFSQRMVEREKYHFLIDVKGKLQRQVPILAVLDGATIQDIFEVLQLGALDYIEKRSLGEDYMTKVSYLKKWKWFLDKIQSD